MSVRMLAHQYFTPAASPPPSIPGEYYSMEPFTCILSIFPSRTPWLSAMKYLGLALKYNSGVIVRPEKEVVMIGTLLEEIWKEVTDGHTNVLCLRDAHDLTDQRSPIA